MLRKLIIKVVISALVFGALPVQAVSLGNITLYSHLSQPLHAEIEVPAIRHEDEASLTISFGSPDLYTRSGLERPAVLDQFVSKLKWRDDGSAYILLRTDKPLNELAVSFFIELSWSGGRILRQYDILLEPTGLQGTIKHSLTGKTVVKVEPAPGSTNNAVASKSPKPSPIPRRPDTSLVARFNGDEVEYGPIRPGESLSRIAQRMRPDPKMSLPQMMVSIFRENKHAFLNNSMNNLVAGSMLHIRKPHLITSVNKEDAKKLVAIHTTEWGGKGVQLATRKQTDPLFEPPVTEREASNRGRIKRGAEATVGQSRLVLSEPAIADIELEKIENVDVSKLSKVEQEVYANRIQQQIMATREAAQLVEEKNRSLRERLQKLQSQIASLQRNIQVIDKQESVLRQQVKDNATIDEKQMVRLLAPNDRSDNLVLDDFMPLPMEDEILADSALNESVQGRLDTTEPVFIAKEVETSVEPVMVAGSGAGSASILAAPPGTINRTDPQFINEPATGEGGGIMMTALSGVSILSLALLGFVARYRREKLEQWLQQLKLRFGKNRTNLPF